VLRSALPTASGEKNDLVGPRVRWKSVAVDRRGAHIGQTGGGAERAAFYAIARSAIGGRKPSSPGDGIVVEQPLGAKGSIKNCELRRNSGVDAEAWSIAETIGGTDLEGEGSERISRELCTALDGQGCPRVREIADGDLEQRPDA
jgi:hypothetical protein